MSLCEPNVKHLPENSSTSEQQPIGHAIPCLIT
jgi:hypothetical protein